MDSMTPERVVLYGIDGPVTHMVPKSAQPGEHDPLLHGKPEERAVWRAVLDGETPAAAGERIGVHPKRVRRWCEKWWACEIYDYGQTKETGEPVMVAPDGSNVFDVTELVTWCIQSLERRKPWWRRLLTRGRRAR